MNTTIVVFHFETLFNYKFEFLAFVFIAICLRSHSSLFFFALRCSRSLLPFDFRLLRQVAVYAAMAPGVLFSDLHVLAERTILEHLWAAGILTSGDEIEEEKFGDMDLASKSRVLDVMQESDLGAIFMPHGILTCLIYSTILSRFLSYSVLHFL